MVRWILLLLAGAAIGAAAQIYEWVDAEGNRHFSDSKPAEGIEYRIRGEDEGRLSTYRSTIRPSAPARRPARRPATPRTRTEPATESSEDLLQAQRCQWYLDRMDRIQAQLRAGYREPRGNTLRRERQEISTKYFRECR